MNGEKNIIRIKETSLENIKQESENYFVFNEEPVLLWAWDSEDIRVVFLSNDKSIRAIEFIDYLVGTYAMVNGDAHNASASISKMFLKVLMSDIEVTDVKDFLKKKVRLYFSECQWIYADEFADEHRQEILMYPKYKKKVVSWAYVKTTNIVNKGEKIKMKSLENESGIVVTASDDLYIMIGCRGEIYSIDRTKFEKTYEVTDKNLDVYEQMLNYLPEVQACSDDRYITIDDLAYLCYPKKQKGIYATQLKTRTKVFNSQNNGEYFVGRKGDFMAVREDDLTDIYIIQRDIFYQTYESE